MLLRVLQSFARRDALRGDPGGVAWWLDDSCDYSQEIGPSPGGTSERILRSQSYNFKNGARTMRPRGAAEITRGYQAQREAARNGQIRRGEDRGEEVESA